MTDLTRMQCESSGNGKKPLSWDEVNRLHALLHERWKIKPEGLTATFEFPDYYRTTAFVNAVAWMSHQQDHHADISFTYSRATVSYWTHAVSALSLNDFICAARIDALFV